MRYYYPPLLLLKFIILNKNKISGHSVIIDILKDQPKGKIDFEAKNNDGKTAIEIATDLATKAVLHKWLMGLDENPTNVTLQRMKNAVIRHASGDYGASDDDSDN